MSAREENYRRHNLRYGQDNRDSPGARAEEEYEDPRAMKDADRKRTQRKRTEYVSIGYPKERQQDLQAEQEERKRVNKRDEERKRKKEEKDLQDLLKYIRELGLENKIVEEITGKRGTERETYPFGFKLAIPNPDTQRLNEWDWDGQVNVPNINKITETEEKKGEKKGNEEKNEEIIQITKKEEECEIHSTRENLSEEREKNTQSSGDGAKEGRQNITENGERKEERRDPSGEGNLLNSQTNREMAEAFESLMDQSDSSESFKSPSSSEVGSGDADYNF